MFIRPELGGKGTACLFQFTYCECRYLSFLVKMNNQAENIQTCDCLSRHSCVFHALKYKFKFASLLDSVISIAIRFFNCKNEIQMHFTIFSSATYNLQQTTISNFAAFSKITTKAWYFMRIVCLQTILMKYHSLFLSKIRKDVAKFVVCCSRDWRFKG